MSDYFKSLDTILREHYGAANSLTWVASVMFLRDPISNESNP